MKKTSHSFVLLTVCKWLVFKFVRSSNRLSKKTDMLLRTLVPAIRQSSIVIRHLLLLGVAVFLTLPALRAADDDKQATPEILPEGTIMYAEIAPWETWSRD